MEENILNPDSNSEIADRIFRSGYNCAQSVLSSFSGELNISDDLALKIATGFGAGMGRKQGVCGAVSGAIMVLGMLYGRGAGGNKENTAVTYQKTRQFIDAFEQEYGSVNCMELLSGCNLMTSEGQERFREENLIEKCCEFVKGSCRIVNKLNLP